MNKIAEKSAAGWQRLLETGTATAELCRSKQLPRLLRNCLFVTFRRWHWENTRGITPLCERQTQLAHTEPFVLHKGIFCPFLTAVTARGFQVHSAVCTKTATKADFWLHGGGRAVAGLFALLAWFCFSGCCHFVMDGSLHIRTQAVSAKHFSEPFWGTSSPSSREAASPRIPAA